MQQPFPNQFKNVTSSQVGKKVSGSNIYGSDANSLRAGKERESSQNDR